MLKRLSQRCKGLHEHQQLAGGRAKACENYPLELISELLRGMRDTADFEEEWGDANEKDLDAAMITSGLLHDVKNTSLVAAYRAQDLKDETERLFLKCKFKNGKTDSTQMVFKDFYLDEYTNEKLPMGEVRLAMQEELEYFNDKVWVVVPLSDAQLDSEGKNHRISLGKLQQQ